MPRIHIADAPWTAPADGFAIGQREEDRTMVEVDEPTEPTDPTAVRYHHPGSETELQLFEVWFPAGHVVKAHAHRTDEVVWVLEGELHLGARLLRPGTSVYLPGLTLYGFTAGPEGLRILNFRATKEIGTISKEQLLLERAASEPSDEDEGDTR